MSASTPEIPAIVADNGRLVIAALGDTRYELLRLTWRERNRAVHGGVAIAAGAVDLAPMAFAQSILGASLAALEQGGVRTEVRPAWLHDCPVELGDRLLTLALHINRREPVAMEQHALGSGRIAVHLASGPAYELVAWTWGVRNQVLAQAMERGSGGMDAAWFHETVLASICRAGSGALLPPDWLADLDANTGDALLEVALRLSGLSLEATHTLRDAVRAGRPHDGVTLYYLCRELGWTPAQIREQLASDIDTLLAVMSAQGSLRTQQIEPRSQRAPGPWPEPWNSPGHATWPDARSDNETIILATDEDDVRFP